MEKHQGPFRLIMNNKGKDILGPNFGFYLAKGFFKKFNGINEIVKEYPSIKSEELSKNF